MLPLQVWSQAGNHSWSGENVQFVTIFVFWGISPCVRDAVSIITVTLTLMTSIIIIIIVIIITLF